MATLITAAMSTQVAQLYVSLFNRAPERDGLGYWVQELANGKTMAQVAADMYAVEPARAVYPSFYTNDQIITAFYTNVLGRTPDAEGKAYWVAKLNASTPGAVVVDMINAVVNYAGTDAAGLTSKSLFANKVTAGLQYAVTDLGNDPVVAANVNALVTADAAGAAVGSGAAAAIAFSSGATAVTTNFALTTGLDTITGTGGNDNIVALIDGTTDAVATTLTTLDSINGGGGTDVLSLNVLNGTGVAGSALAALPSVSMTAVETVNIRTAVELTDADLSTWTGVTTVNLTEVAAGKAVALTAGATADINVVGKSAEAALDLFGGKNVTVALTDVAAAELITVGGAAADAPKGIVTVTTTGAATVADADVLLGDITVTGGSSINVVTKATGNAAAAATDIAGATITQGAVNVNGNAVTTAVSVKQDATVDEVLAEEAVAAVATTQEITFTKAVADDVVTLDFGTGTLSFTAKKALTAVEVATAFANLVEDALQGKSSAKNGIYTDVAGGVTDGWTSGAVVVVDADNAKVKFSNDLAAAAAITTGVVGTVTATAAAAVAGVDEVVAITGVLGTTAGVVTIADSVAATIKTITVDGYDTGSAITASTVLSTLNLANARDGVTMDVADTAATLALTVEKLGSKVTTPEGVTTSETAALTLTLAPTTLNVTSTGANYIDLTADATETLNVSGTGLLDVSGLDLVAVTTVKVTGTAGLKLHADVASSLTSVDTTGTTGSVTVSIAGDTSTYAGGAGADSVTVTNPGTAISKAINLGAGNDTLDLSAATPLVPTVVIEGGEGTDTLALLAADAASLSGAISFEAKINSFEKLNVKAALVADATIDLDNLDSINYVVTNGDGGFALLLDNMLAAATVELKAAGTGSIEVALADVAGTSDVVNVVVNAATTVDVGTVIANGVETVNVTVKDTDVNTVDTVTSVNDVTISGDAVKTITVAGAGATNLFLDAASTEVTLIDGSSATGVLTVSTLAVDTAATTVKGGAGDDVLNAFGAADVLQGGAGADVLAVVGSAASAATLTGGAGIDTFDVSGFVAANAGAAVTITDLAKGEIIKFVASGFADFNSAKVTLISEATFTEYVTEAATQADAASGGDHGVAWFQFGVNTFIVQDVDGDGQFTNGSDIVVKITGLVDLSASSFNNDTNGSLMFL